MKKVAWWSVALVVCALVARYVLGRGARSEHNDPGEADVVERVVSTLCVAATGVCGFVRSYLGNDDVRVESDVFVSSPLPENDHL